MKVVIFDIEASCQDRNISKFYPMECIEIGAVKLENGKVIEEFQTFIKPTKVTELTPFCTHLTGIKFEDLKDAPSFEEGMKAFADFADGHLLYSCGEFDKKFLLRELKEKKELFKDKELNNQIQSMIDISHRNLKVLFSRVTDQGFCGMNKMAKILNVTVDGTAHRGLDDSRNLAKIFFELDKMREEKLRNVISEEMIQEFISEFNKRKDTDVTFSNFTYLEFIDLMKAGSNVVSPLFELDGNVDFVVSKYGL